MLSNANASVHKQKFGLSMRKLKFLANMSACRTVNINSFFLKDLNISASIRKYSVNDLSDINRHETGNII
jgi:hypothetical protein